MIKKTSLIYRFQKTFDLIFRIMVWVCGILGMILPLWIISYILVNGAGTFSWNLLLDIPRGFPLGTEGGIFPAIQGSLALTVIGLLVALPTGIGGAIYLSEFCPSQKIKSIAGMLINTLAGVPSIIYGLFGYVFFVVLFKMGISLLAGGLVLGVVMLPIILITSAEAFQAVGPEYREATLALGVDRFQWMRRVLLKKSWGRILAGIVLAVGHAIGSASPVLFTASVYFSKGGLQLDHPVMTLPTHLYYLVAEAVSFDQAYGTALVLILGLIIFNSSAMLLRYLTKNL